MQRSVMAIVFYVATSTATARAVEYVVDFDTAPKSQFIDRWVYPFNVSPGTRIQAPTFGAVGSEGFDDRDGQFLIAVDSANIGIPAGGPTGQYEINRVRLTLTETVGGYLYDATYDTFGTYLDGTSPQSTPDSDAGRPLELYGAGFRGGFETFVFPDGASATLAPEFSAASAFGVTGRGTRNVFAADADGQDVSNNVDSLQAGLHGFDPTPFAVGQAFDGDRPLTPGEEVTAGTEFVFDVNLQDPAIHSYFQRGLALGQLGFVVTSLHATGELGAGDPYTNLATADHFAISGPRLTIDVSIVDRVVGDFDGDGTLSANDIDQLASAIINNSSDLFYDLDSNGIVDNDDHRYWVESLFGTYFGDANLDREFDTNDVIFVLQANEYEDHLVRNSTWETGDWDGDREFTTSDVILALETGAYEQGPRPVARVVPAPHGSSTLCSMGLCVVGWLRRRRRGRLAD